MATPVSTCCTPQLKDRQLNSVFSHRITSFQERLWYSVWIREGVSGISRRGTERLLTQSQPLCTVYSIAFPPEQRGVSCISEEFWSQLLPDIDATVHRSVLQLMQCICWSERLLSQNCYVRLYKRGSEWMRKQVEILSSDCLSCTAAQLLPEQFPVPILSRLLQFATAFRYEAASSGWDDAERINLRSQKFSFQNAEQKWSLQRGLKRSNCESNQSNGDQWTGIKTNRR